LGVAGFFIGIVMAYKTIAAWLVVFYLLFARCESAWAKFVVHSQTTVEIELIGFDGLAESSIFRGELTAGDSREIDTSYRGLALLVFAGGQRYPVIFGEKPFTLKIVAPGKSPSFAGSEENDFFYKALSGGDSPPDRYDFAHLMIEAKNLLKSSQSVKTVKDLAAKKIL
jgi:hypothetical protein